MEITPEAKALVEELWNMAQVQPMFEVAQRHLDGYADARACRVCRKNLGTYDVQPVTEPSSATATVSTVAVDAELSY